MSINVNKVTNYFNKTADYGRARRATGGMFTRAEFPDQLTAVGKVKYLPVGLYYKAKDVLNAYFNPTFNGFNFSSPVVIGEKKESTRRLSSIPDPIVSKPTSLNVSNSFASSTDEKTLLELIRVISSGHINHEDIDVLSRFLQKDKRLFQQRKKTVFLQRIIERLNSFSEASEIYKNLVDGINELDLFDRVIIYKVDEMRKMWAIYARGREIENSSYYNGKMPDDGEVMDIAIREGELWASHKDALPVDTFGEAGEEISIIIDGGTRKIKVKGIQIINNPAEDSRCNPDKVKSDDGKPFVIIPIVLNDKVVAILNLNNWDSNRPLDIEDINFVKTLSDLCAEALKNIDPGVSYSNTSYLQHSPKIIYDKDIVIERIINPAKSVYPFRNQYIHDLSSVVLEIYREETDNLKTLVHQLLPGDSMARHALLVDENLVARAGEEITSFLSGDYIYTGLNDGQLMFYFAGAMVKPKWQKRGLIYRLTFEIVEAALNRARTTFSNDKIRIIAVTQNPVIAHIILNLFSEVFPNPKNFVSPSAVDVNCAEILAQKEGFPFDLKTYGFATGPDRYHGRMCEVEKSLLEKVDDVPLKDMILSLTNNFDGRGIIFTGWYTKEDSERFKEKVFKK